MSTIWIILILVILFGGFGGSYYGYNHFGAWGGGLPVGLILLIIVVLWLAGAFPRRNGS